MKNLHILQSKDTPEINFKDTGEFNIKGISIPENPLKFYQDLFTWIDVYKISFPNKIQLTIYVEYMNTGSKKLMIQLLKHLIMSCKNRVELEIVWMYDMEDDDIKDEGEVIEEAVNFSFIFKLLS